MQHNNIYIFSLGAFDPTEFTDGIRQIYNIREGWLAPFPWCEYFRFNLDNIFTRLKIVSRKKERGTKNNETVAMNEIFKPHEECANPRTVLIEGKPGIGKTTYCNKLAYDWATKKLGEENPEGFSLPNFQEVLLLKCRDIQSNLCESSEEQHSTLSAKEKEKEFCTRVLWDAIDDQLLPRDITKEDKEEFFKFVRNNQPDILLVLDGLDELTTNLLPPFIEIIQGRMLPKCHILVTARSEVGMKVRECCDSLLEIEGFTQENAREFIVKYFKTEAEELAQKLLNKLERDQNLRQLTESPLNTALLCLLCEDFNGIFPQTGTQLYLEIVECVLRRYRKKKGLPDINGEDLIVVYNAQLKQLGSIALNGLLNGNVYFERSEFGNFGDELPEFGFLSVERGRSKRRPAVYYFFIHKTFQELFAAFYLCHQIRDNEVSPEILISDNRYFGELKQLLVFTCGLLASQSKEMIKALITSIAGQVDDGDKLLDALECIKECNKERESTLHMLLARTLGSVLRITVLDLSDNSLLENGDCITLAETIKYNSTVTELDLSANGLGDGECTALAEAIKHNSTITQMDLSANDLCIGSCTALAEAIKHNSTITQLDLSRNGLGTGDCTTLAKAIKHNSTITQLDLSENKLGTGNYSALAEAIKHNSTITQLDMSRNKLGTGDGTALAEAIKQNSTITQLDLSSNEFGTGDCTALAEAIKHNSTITQLDLSWNMLGDGGSIALAEAIKHNPTIAHLDLSCNRLKVRDCFALSEAVKLNSAITQLDLHRNNLDAADCTALAEGIKHNSAITQLNLRGNRVADGDCTALAEALKHNTTITQLDLSSNVFGDEDFTALAEAIKQNSTITQLDLSSNEFGTGDCTALAEAIKHNSTITQLDLSENELGTGDCSALAEAIKHNSTITQLDLSHNRLGDGDSTALVEAITHNSTISQVNLSTNSFSYGDFAALTEVIKHSLTITQLDLSHNLLGFGDSTPLLEAIKHNEIITHLNLSHNVLCGGDCTALAEAMKHNSTITQLNLSDNGLGTGDCTALAEAIKHNLTLTELNLSGNILGAGDCTALPEAIKHNSAITQLNLSRNVFSDGDCNSLAEAIKHNSRISHELDLSRNNLGYYDDLKVQLVLATKVSFKK